MTSSAGLALARETRLAVIGGGRMGEAIIAGLVSSGALESSSITVVEPSPGRRSVLTDTYGVLCFPTPQEIETGFDVALLAVKPQALPSVLPKLAPIVGSALVISIAAGVTTTRLESVLPQATAVVRVMPNTPVMAGQGMSVICPGAEVSDEQIALAQALFGSVGETIILAEQHLDAATAISGCGPAYMAIVIDALTRAGVQHGLSREAAQALVVQTMRGTADLLETTGAHPAQLADDVASPGGATAAAIAALEESGLRSAFAKAVNAAVTRAKELNP
ncbi:MAG: pyrroline-5-carboxylate reductase [Actinobacteria bacterium]|nr:pyrroline-5-carboxylate reductase [Actinomycetota bacterium]MCL5887284.1 pyrroline-5-carboxylate reductase [Actinomycetota bacterium]